MRKGICPNPTLCDRVARKTNDFIDFSVVRSLLFYGRLRTVYISKDGKMVFVMTTSGGITMRGVKVGSRMLRIENVKQRYVFISLEKDALIIGKCIPAPHVYNNNWQCFGNFAGNIVRLNMSFKFSSTRCFLYQGNNNVAIEF
jgi:hypothetical protein